MSGFSVEERFWQRVNQTESCWFWTGAVIPSRGLDYGVFQNKRVHRYSYELLKGPIPEGKELDHLCRKTLCVNPDHLEPVTHKVNLLRGNGASGVNARKTVAICGHPFTGRDILMRRYCKPCRAKWQREYYHRRSKGGAGK